MCILESYRDVTAEDRMQENYKRLLDREVDQNRLLQEEVNKRTLELSRANEALRSAQARMVRLERDAAEAQMAGGFAHEMRNALAGSKMVLDHALGRLRGAGKSLCEGRLELIDRVIASEAAAGESAAALRQVRENQAALQKTLNIVSRATDRGLAFTAQVVEY